MEKKAFQKHVAAPAPAPTPHPAFASGPPSNTALPRASLACWSPSQCPLPSSSSPLARKPPTGRRTRSSHRRPPSPRPLWSSSSDPSSPTPDPLQVVVVGLQVVACFGAQPWGLDQRSLLDPVAVTVRAASEGCRQVAVRSGPSATGSGPRVPRGRSGLKAAAPPGFQATLPQA
jgi:hypothetical protein